MWHLPNRSFQELILICRVQNQAMLWRKALLFCRLSFPSHPASTYPAPVTFSDVSLLQNHRRRWHGAVWSPHPRFVASSAKPIALLGVAGKWSAAVTRWYLLTTQKGSSCQTPTGIYKIVYCRANGGEMIKHGISVFSSEIWWRKKTPINYLFKSSYHNVSV